MHRSVVNKPEPAPVSKDCSNMHQRYRKALCPYLVVGNRRILVHLDAYCVPQSFQWPRPGSVDRLGWRDRFDEWPYWNELTDEAVRGRMPYFEYKDGTKDYMHDAVGVTIDYIKDTNVLEGRYNLPGGAEICITTFVMPHTDIWIRHYDVRGEGKFVLQSEFFEKAVRGNPQSHLGDIDFRGAFDAAPQGAYVILSTCRLPQESGLVRVPIDGERSWTVAMCIASNIAEAHKLGLAALEDGYESLKNEAIQSDHAWIARAKTPECKHPFVLKDYKRWLLSNILMVGEDGAMIAGARPFWSFSWPRDCSLAAAGFAAAGYVEDAQKIVKWHLDNTPASGIHEARYFTDRTPVKLDNRPCQGDNPGFLAWAASFICRQQWDEDFVASIKDHVYQLADLLVEHRDAQTLLPLPEADYMESGIAESICLAVTAIGGLNGASYIAKQLGESDRAEEYQARAQEIKCGVFKHMWDDTEHYIYSSINPINKGSDVATCWGVYPFGAFEKDDERIKQAIERIVRDFWDDESGGVLYAPGTPVESYWFFYTGILLLGIAGIGDHRMEMAILNSLEKNTSPQGLIPEQVDRYGKDLWGCAPLPIAHACLLLYAYHTAAV